MFGRKSSSGVRVGLGLQASMELGESHLMMALGKAPRAKVDSVVIPDHLQGLFPMSLWMQGSNFTWRTTKSSSPHQYADAFALAGRLANTTNRLRLQMGIAVTDLIRRDPVQVAQGFSTLAHFYDRPFLAGVGGGEMWNYWYLQHLRTDRPIGRFAEGLEILHHFLHGPSGPWSFEGQHFQLERAVMDTRPPTNRMPQIMVGGWGPRMRQLTGRFGDIFYPVMIGVSPQDYAQAMQDVRDSAKSHGRSPDQIIGGGLCYLMIAKDDNHLIRLLEAPIMQYLGSLMPAEILEPLIGHQHLYGANFKGYHSFLPEEQPLEDLQQMMASVKQAASKMIQAGMFLCGTEDQIVEQLRQLVEAGLQFPVLEPASALVSESDAQYSFLATRRIARRLHQL